VSSPGAVSRRVFITASVAAGGGLALTIWARRFLHEPPLDPATAALAPDAWVRLGTDGWLTVMVARSEMGQGVSTALPMLVAEEMDADWDRVHFEFAPANAAYYNPAMGLQATGGSTAVWTAWMALRQAGATARAMLLAAAAERLGVAEASLRTDSGTVVHDASGRRLHYGDLAEAAGQRRVPAEVPLKDPSQFRLIGTDRQRLDTHAKITGRAVFGIDAGPEDTLVAVVARSPVLGGRLERVDDTAARAVPGVRDVVRISSGVAVVADGYWAATQGREALALAWDEGEHPGLDDAAISRKLRALADDSGRSVREEWDGDAALAAAAVTVEAEYELPYLAHACMEPMNCTADVRADGVTVWAPTQFQAGPRYMAGGGTRGAAARIAGVSLDEVEVVTTYLGGGFGRRAEVDFVIDACETSKAVGRPVRVIYSREDDLQHDFYRPASFHRLSAAMDATGQVTAWRHRIVSPSIIRRFIPGGIPDVIAHLGGPMKGGVDPAAVEGIADLPYAVGAMDITYSEADLGVPVGYWRSVGHSSNAFVVESFVDELAAAAGVDPVVYRRRLLADHARHLGVLETAATAAGWGTPLPEGRARGVAVHESFGSFVAQVAEVSVEEGKPRVHRVTCAVDCGTVVNPDTVRAQMEGGIGFGLSAALGERVAIEGGRVVPGNFDGYPILTMSQMPVVEVLLVPSGDGPGGVGEPGTPPIAPAVCNALFALTGQRIRRLPIQLS
jgi:isoquinoline 1-oxidoreductase beta subunit